MRICLPDSVTANNAHLVFIGVVHERGQLQQMIYIKTVQNRYQLHEVRFCAFDYSSCMDGFVLSKGRRVIYNPNTRMQICKQKWPLKNYHQMMARTIVMPPVQLNVFSSGAS